MDVPKTTFNHPFKHHTLMYGLLGDHCSVFQQIIMACKNNKIHDGYAIIKVQDEVG